MSALETTGFRVATATKQRIFLAALLLLCVWPLVHFALARRYRINHWRFAGFGMYTRPAYQPKLVFSGTVNGQPLTGEMLKITLGKDLARVDEFVFRRKMWGRFAKPDALAELLLRRMPALPELDIIIITVGLEPGADSYSSTTERYRCVPRAVPTCVRVSDRR